MIAHAHIQTVPWILPSIVGGLLQCRPGMYPYCPSVLHMVRARYEAEGSIGDKNEQSHTLLRLDRKAEGMNMCRHADSPWKRPSFFYCLKFFTFCFGQFVRAHRNLPVDRRLRWPPLMPRTMSLPTIVSAHICKPPSPSIGWSFFLTSLLTAQQPY